MDRECYYDTYNRITISWAFSSQLATAFKQKEFEPILYNLLQDPGIQSLLKKLRFRHRIVTCIIGKNLYNSCDCSLSISINSVITMRARIVSGILFLLSAIVIGVMTVGTLLPVYLLYFVVAVMLFARKAPENPVDADFTQTPEKPEIDRLEYL